MTQVRDPDVKGGSTIHDPAVPTRGMTVNDDGSINVRQNGAAASAATFASNTTTGSSQIVFAANASRLGFLIECPTDTTLNPSGKSIFVNLGATATQGGDSYEVTPGGYFPPPSMPLWLGIVTVIGDAAFKYIAKEFTA